MARRTVYIDDITEKEIPHGKGGTVRVGLDGAWYEVDLHDDSKAKLQELLSPYIDEDRRVRDQAPRTASPGVTRAPMTMRYSSETMAEATAWAKSEEGEKALEKANVKYSGVGRTPYAVVEEYLKTQKS